MFHTHAEWVGGVNPGVRTGRGMDVVRIAVAGRAPCFLLMLFPRLHVQLLTVGSTAESVNIMGVKRRLDGEGVVVTGERMRDLERRGGGGGGRDGMWG